MAGNKKRIAVLGAGPMGLAAAYEIALQGHQPVIFEADDRIGGMTASFDFNGLMIERFYHFHCTSDTDFLQLLDELGLADKMRWVATRMGFYYRGHMNEWGNPFALLRFRGLGIIPKFRYGLFVWLATHRSDWKRLDKVVATDWIRNWVGGRAYDVLWRSLMDLKFYNFADKISAAWIWNRIYRIGRSRKSLFEERLGHLDGGSNTLLQALRQKIEEKDGQLRLSTPVKRIVIENGKTRGIETANGIEEFDAVVSTVPLPYVPALLKDAPEELREKYRKFDNIAVVCVIAKLAKPVTPYFWVNINDDSMDIPGIVEYTNLRPLDHHIVYVPFYMPGEHPNYKLPDADFIAKVKKYLLQLNPALSESDIIDIRASRYRHAQPVCTPGHLGRLPPAHLPYGNLWVADTAYYYPNDRGISESVGLGRQLAREAIA